MNEIIIYFRRRKELIIVLAILFVMGFLIGAFLGFTNLEVLKDHVLFFASHIIDYRYTLLFAHFTFLSLGVVLSLVGIGIPILFSLFFLEALSLGLLISLFFSLYFFKGLVFAFLFFLTLKGFYVLALFFLISKCLKMTPRVLFQSLNNKENDLKCKKLFLSCFVLIFFDFFFDFFLSIFGSKFIHLFSFLLT